MTYTTQFGSLDNHFKPIGSQQFVKVPDGVAHFLEHKLLKKKKKIYLQLLPRKMHKQTHLQVLTVQVIYLVLQAILRVTLSVY